MSKNLNKKAEKNETKNSNEKEIDRAIYGRRYECRDVDTRNFINVPISKRVVPSNTMETAYFTHPTTTRKRLMPIIDCRKEPDVNKMVYSIYHPSKTFNPGQSAPYNGYASHVDHESILFNRFAPLQRGGQHEFIPHSRSELYNEHQYNHNKQHIPFALLNKKEYFNPFNPNKEDLANNIFENHTRQQTKNL
jgi:hypothetical protein